VPRDLTALRRAAAIVLLALTPVAAWVARGVTIDNRLERWVAQGTDDERHYTAFRETFGSDEFIVVAVGGRPLFQPEAARLLGDCLTKLEAVEGVVRVQGLPQVHRDLFSGEDLAELEREMTSTPFYTGLLLSADGGTAALLVEVAPDEDPAARRRLVEAVRAATTPLTVGGFRVGLVGSTVLITALDELSAREALWTFPLAVLGSLLVLAALLRSARAMIAAAAAAGSSVALTLGLVVTVGGSLNMLTAALPALLWVLSVSYAVHIAARYRVLRRDRPAPEAVEQALSRTRIAVFFSALTTVLGFLSLLTATMPPVRELGMLGALGSAVAFVVSQTVVPLLLGWFDAPAARLPAPSSGSRWGSLLELPMRAPRTVLAACAAAFVIAVASIPAIRLESNPLAFLPAAHPVARDYRWVGEQVAGFYTAETVVRLPAPWTDPAAWPVLDGVARSLAASQIVSRVVTPLDLLRKLEQWDSGFDPAAYRLPADRAAAERLVAQLDPRGRAVLAGLVAPSGREVRLSAVVREMDEGKFLGLVRDARATLGRLPAGYDGYVTGQVLRLVGAQQGLIATQLRSLFAAFALVFLAVWAGLRSWRLTLVAVPPNLLPISVTFAIMAWLSIPLDAATVMVASVALGVAVDNSLHYLIEVSRGRHAGLDPPAATRAALTLTAPAIAAATGAAIIGFGSLVVSSFLPIRYFGGLCGALMAVALVADLLLTPAILAAAPALGRDASPR
jgi:uncharacterized protein